MLRGTNITQFQSRILRGSLCSYITIACDIARDHKAQVYNKSLPEWRSDKASCRHFQESRQTVTFFENERSYMTFYINLELICTSEFFKKLKLHEPLPYDYLLTI